MSGTPVSSGVTSHGLVLGNGGVLDILSGGTAVSTTVSAGGLAEISRGGSALGTVVTSRGLVEILSGGVASATVLSGYGSEEIYGASVSATVGYAASQSVFAGGTALGSVVAGAEVVASGGITIGVQLIDGYETVSSGGLASGTVVAAFSGAFPGNGQIYVSSGGTMLGGVVNHNGYAGLSAGAVAIGTTLSGGGEGVAGGTAIGTTIGAGGIETVSVVYIFSTGDYLSGVVSATTIAGGTLDLAGGSATGGILFAGSGPGLLEISGTVMPATPIGGFASTDAIDLQSIADTGSGTVSLNPATDVLTVTEGGSSVALQLAGSYVGTTFSLGPDSGSGTIVAIDHGSAIAVPSGVTSHGLTLSNGDVLDVLPGGTAVSTLVSAGGVVEVSRGGSALGTVVTSRGLVEVLSGGEVVASGGVASGSNGPERLWQRGGLRRLRQCHRGLRRIAVRLRRRHRDRQRRRNGSEVVASGGVTNGVQLIDGSETVASGSGTIDRGRNDAGRCRRPDGFGGLSATGGILSPSARPRRHGRGGLAISGTADPARPPWVTPHRSSSSQAAPRPARHRRPVARGETVASTVAAAGSGRPNLRHLGRNDAGRCRRSAGLSAGAVAIGTTLSGGDMGVAGGTAIGTIIGAGGVETASVVYVFSVSAYETGVASATTIAGGTLDLAGGSATGGILFAGSGPGLLEISGTVMPATPIGGFASTDAIDLQGVADTGSGTVSLNPATDVLTVTEGGSSVALQLAGSYVGTTFSLGPDSGPGTLITASTSGTVVGTSGVPCFAAGTRIAGERGLTEVEHLAIGDRLMTVEGELKAITWIGSRRVDCRRHPEPMKVWPVHVAVNAFGPGAPRRELLLSPDHAVFAEGVLIPVKHLINGSTVRQIATLAVTYYHVELSLHSVILAEGLPVESYLDSGDRTSFETADGVITLHPAFASERADIAIFMEALGYAPLRVTGPEVAAVQARLAEHVPRGFGRI
ncbi:Hint domain-containing protein [Acidisoma sp.]|uniref:Hint domain-containing protein n=1 Tax=Acidisoma sp. TaxID=1872115 RepID=UPI003B0046BC